MTDIFDNGGNIGKVISFTDANTYTYNAVAGTYEEPFTLSRTNTAGTTISDNDGSVNTTYATTLTFPVSPTDGLIWETGATGTGAWCGIRDSGVTLRVRGGDGATSKTASTVDTAVVDITDFPKDGQSHVLMWDFEISTGTARIFIDGILKGESSATGGSFDNNLFAGPDDGAYLNNAGGVGVTAGESSTPCNFTEAGSGLRVYLSQLASETSVSGNKKNSGIWSMDAVYQSLWDLPPASFTTDGLIVNVYAGDSSSYPGSGTTWFDLTASSYDGVLTNGPTFSTNKFAFDGVDDTVAFSSYATHKIANTFSYEFWATPTTTITINSEATTGITGISGQRFIKYPTQEGSARGAGVSVGINGVMVYLHGDNEISPPLAWSGTLSSTTPTHLVVTFDNKSPKLYVDGTLVRSGLTAPETIYGGFDYVGGFIYGKFQGDIYLGRFYNKVLNATEIANNYNYFTSELGL